MPTKADFEAAAEKLSTAAQQVGDLTVAAEGAGASDILRGGSLGRQVPERIATSSESATTCVTLISDVEATCRERAGIIAEYEIELDAYKVQYSRYQSAYSYWSYAYGMWWSDPTVYGHPGPAPYPPTKPTPPPPWADVERP